MTAKKYKLDHSKLSPRTFAECFAVWEWFLKFMQKSGLVSDLAVEDFEQLRADFAKFHGVQADATERVPPSDGLSRICEKGRAEIRVHHRCVLGQPVNAFLVFRSD